MVTAQEDDPHATRHQGAQGGQDAEVAAEHRLVVLEPEVEEIAQDVERAGGGCVSFEEGEHAGFACVAVGGPARAQMVIPSASRTRVIPAATAIRSEATLPVRISA